MLDKDPLFAALTLKDDEHTLYRQIYDHLHPQVAAADLVIYLQASRPRSWSGCAAAAPSTSSTSATSTWCGSPTPMPLFHDYSAAPVLIVIRSPQFRDSRDALDLLLAVFASMRGPREFVSSAD